MKTLYLIRHAKSSWKDVKLDDFDRCLNKRGKKDAPFMASNLKKRKITPQLLISSDAKRAYKTSKIFVQKLHIKKYIYNRKLYDKHFEKIDKVVQDIPNFYHSVAICGHNPSLNSFIKDYLAIDQNIPTSGIVAIQFDCDLWKDISKSNAKLQFFIYPKLYKDENISK